MRRRCGEPSRFWRHVPHECCASYGSFFVSALGTKHTDRLPCTTAGLDHAPRLREVWRALCTRPGLFVGARVGSYRFEREGQGRRNVQRSGRIGTSSQQHIAPPHSSLKIKQYSAVIATYLKTIRKQVQDLELSCVFMSGPTLFPSCSQGCGWNSKGLISTARPTYSEFVARSGKQ